MPHCKNCAQCGVQYKVPLHRLDKSKFCSVACAKAGQKKTPSKLIPCAFCSKEFASIKDHGVWRKFCSRECFCARKPKPEPKTCPSCDAVFIAEETKTGKSEDGLRIYCSKKCAQFGLRIGEERDCKECGKAFHLSPSKAKLLNVSESCCSWDCHKAFYKEDMSPSWNGGTYLSASAGHKFTRLVRPGHVGKYIGDHRLIASQAIGRILERYEAVLHINKNKQDNNPANLFICGTRNESGKIRSGSIPYPTTSNLETFK